MAALREPAGSARPPESRQPDLAIKAPAPVENGYSRRDLVLACPPLGFGQTFSAERFQKELYAQMAAAQRSAAQQRLVLLLGPVAEPYLRHLADTDRSLARHVRELFELIRDYGPEAVAGAVQKAHAGSISEFELSVIRSRMLDASADLDKPRSASLETPSTKRC